MGGSKIKTTTINNYPIYIDPAYDTLSETKLNCGVMFNNEHYLKESILKTDKRIVALGTYNIDLYEESPNEIKIEKGTKSWITPKQFVNKEESKLILQNQNISYFDIPETRLNKASIKNNADFIEGQWDVVAAIIHYNFKKSSNKLSQECWVLLDDHVFSIFIFIEGKLKFYNYFDNPINENILYFITICFQNAKMDFNTSEIYLTGNTPSNELIDCISLYCGQPSLDFSEFTIGNQKFSGWFHWINHILKCV